MSLVILGLSPYLLMQLNRAHNDLPISAFTQFSILHQPRSRFHVRSYYGISISLEKCRFSPTISLQPRMLKRRWDRRCRSFALDSHTILRRLTYANGMPFRYHGCRKHWLPCVIIQRCAKPQCFRRAAVSRFTLKSTITKLESHNSNRF